MSGQTITIKGKDGSFSGYLAPSAQGRGPGIVVIQEIFGVNPFVRQVADHFAALGFTALAPDLFWRLEPNVQLVKYDEADFKRAFGFYEKFNIDKGVEDLQATIDTLRVLPSCTGKVGDVGFCLGGLLAYLSATRTNADASVGFYGVSIEARLEEAKNIKKPLMLHVAGADKFVPPEAQQKMSAGLAGNKHVTIHTYAGQDHAFARNGGDAFDKASADLANQRTLDFFNANLK